MSPKEVIQQLVVISRERALVKSAPISDEMRSKLLADLERQALALQLTDPVKTEVDVAAGQAAIAGVQPAAAPKGRSGQ